jgi:hypothetical protein
VVSFFNPELQVGKSDLYARLITLNGMKASEEITDEQSRQVGFEVDTPLFIRLVINKIIAISSLASV